MHLYCTCGYPLVLAVSWDGTDYYLVLRDGTRGPGSPPIAYCLQCGQGLVLEELARRPPTILDWHPRPEAEPDTERTG